MISLRRISWILRPSLLSGIIAFFLTSVLLGSAGWAYISDSGLFYDQLFGAYGAVTILQLQPHNLPGIQDAVLNGPATYYVLLITGALIAGISIYLLLESASLVGRGASLFISQVHANRKSAREAARATLVRLGLHITALIAWALYWLVFANVLVPLVIIMLQQALDAISSAQAIGWLMLLIPFIILAGSIHFHATFARLVFLRVRLLGGVDAELSRLESEHD